MRALLFAVATGLLATMVWWVGTRAVRFWKRLRLWRLARGNRRVALTLLNRRLVAPLAGGLHRSAGRWNSNALASSFRLKVESRLDLPHLVGEGAVIGADELVAHIESQRGDLVYLINSDSGFGKTALGLTLPLLRFGLSRDRLVPLYIDLGEANGERPLAALESLLGRLGRERELLGRPLFVFDALNETVDPEYFAEKLATKRDELEAIRAQLLFLFSFRHRSYPGRLRSALVNHGFCPLESMELLFEIEEESDLAFFPKLLPPGRRSATMADLREYATRFPTALSRKDVASYLGWRYLDLGRQAASAPPPSSLCLARTLGQDVSSVEPYFQLAQVAFLLLGVEVTATTYTHIAESTGISEEQLRQCVGPCGMEDLVHCGVYHLRFEDETTVRVFGAVEVARQLIEGKSPPSLRGRTTYDVCAPYVQPALRWLAQSDYCGDTSQDQLAAPLVAALSGLDAPYSFYATVLCSDDACIFGNNTDEINARLFHAMIAAIDEDRGQTCRGSLEAAGRGEPELVLDPVLDQLFEVMAAYGRRAVGQLLILMEDPSPLIRSQAAYLLLNWIDSLPSTLGAEDQELLSLIPSRMVGTDGNLHFRFHQVELLERLLELFPNADESARRQTLATLSEIASNLGDTGAVGSFGEFQRLVSLRASQLVESAPPATVAAQLRDNVSDCMAAIEADSGFEYLGAGAIGEARLECWEVGLGMATRASWYVRQNADFISFLETAFEHEYWIVRWWAFAGLIDIIKQASASQNRVLASKCARRVVRELYTSVEPMGLKHRQCAVVKQMRDGNDAAARVLRAALAEARAPSPAAPEGQEFAERYYKVMGASPDEYLAGFSRRLDGIVATQG